MNELESNGCLSDVDFDDLNETIISETQMVIKEDPFD